jgi:transposase
LRRYGKRLTVNHSKLFLGRRASNYTNGIVDYWSYAEQILYDYRVVSKYHFLMYLKKIE